MCVNCCDGKPGRCCHQCSSNRQGYANVPGHRFFLKEFGVYPNFNSEAKMALKRPETNGAGKPVATEFNDHEFKSEYPNIHEYIGCSKWDDGKFRKTSTLLFFVDEGSIKLAMNDRALDRQAFISARTFTEALSLLDDALGQDTVIWRANKAYQKK